MQRDFTYDIYSALIDSLKESGFVFLPFIDFISDGSDFERCVVLKHDVDKLPENALRMANLEKRLGIKTSYYFRTINRVYDESIIEKIAGLGHEVSYHYEDLTIAKGDYNKAIQLFEKNLKKIRKFCPAKTICMHGSPLSKFDNQKIWEKYDYRDYGIIADPYFDVDFNEVFYITDTGRSWNNSKVSVRDKVASGFDIDIKNGLHLIELILKNKLPDQIMLNVHPHRWFDYGYNWYKELFVQNFKNQIKSIIVRMKGK